MTASSLAPAPAPSAPRAGSLLGLELEMPLAKRSSGTSHAVQSYFDTLARVRAAQGRASTPIHAAGRCIGLQDARGESGLDNGFNLLETAFAPIDGERPGLAGLHAWVVQELRDAEEALAAEDAMVLNASEHPHCPITAEWYAQVRAPRPIYEELVGHRGWHHHLGIDAKAQNSPCTAVPVQDAARALNVVLALAPAAIALYANSPIASGEPTGLKEHRLTLWPGMFAATRFPGDWMLQALPDQPFDDLGAYFRWLYGPHTASRSLPSDPGSGYKGGAPVYLAGDPALSTFLRASGWQASRPDGSQLTLTPSSAHFEYAQFAQFLDARWRFRLQSKPALAQLLRAWDTPQGLEALLAEHGVSGYIEGRGPGANFADPQLVQEAGEAIARTTVISPSAIQLGLLRNLDQACDLVRSWGWATLKSMRDVAIRDALADDRVHALCRDVLGVCQGGLDAADHHWLAYPRHVCETRRTGADRMLTLWHSLAASPRDRLVGLCAARRALAL